MWLFVAAGIVAVASVLPQTRAEVSKVDWMPLAVLFGLCALSGSIDTMTERMRGSLDTVTERIRQNREYDAEYVIHYDVRWGAQGAARSS